MKDMKKVRLVKSRTNKLLTGVCGGIGELIGIDPTIIRLIWAALSLGRRLWRYFVHHCSCDYS